MTPYLLVGLAAFAHIGLKAWMQQVVISGHYMRVFPTSACLAFVEVYVISTIADRGIGLVVLPLFVGGSLGCCSSMAFYRWLAARKESR